MQEHTPNRVPGHCGKDTKRFVSFPHYKAAIDRRRRFCGTLVRRGFWQCELCAAKPKIQPQFERKWGF
jgi:hypothetical protein